MEKYFLVLKLFEMILGFDPGRDKCGLAVLGDNYQIYYHQIVDSKVAIATIQKLFKDYSIEKLVMGDRTTSKIWQSQLKENLDRDTDIIMVDEHNSTLEARDRYWHIYPPTGLTKLIPRGMRVPPRPVDDIVAIILIERYLSSKNNKPF